MLKKIDELEREQHRRTLQLEKLDYQYVFINILYVKFNYPYFRIHDLLPLTKNRRNLPTIFFVTPTSQRPAQKADLIRLYHTLSYVPNLHWIIVEDADAPSPSIDEILARTRLKSVHLTAKTPTNKKLRSNEPNWLQARGVHQRNTALEWIR